MSRGLVSAAALRGFVMPWLLRARSQLLELLSNGKKPSASAEIDYDDVVMKGGFADSGTITVSVDREEHELDVEDAFVVDFRGLIPLEQAAE